MWSYQIVSNTSINIFIINIQFDIVKVNLSNLNILKSELKYNYSFKIISIKIIVYKSAYKMTLQDEFYSKFVLKKLRGIYLLY